MFPRGWARLMAVRKGMKLLSNTTILVKAKLPIEPNVRSV